MIKAEKLDTVTVVYKGTLADGTVFDESPEERPLKFIIGKEEVIAGFNTSYGYQWWRGTFSNGNIDTYYAAGFGGQFIFVLPEMEMVIVFTAGQFEGGYNGFVLIVNDHILAATNDLN